MERIINLMLLYLFYWLVSLDQLLNTTTFGYPDETLSSRIYRNARLSKKWRAFEIFVDTLFFWQDYHCEMAYYTELQGGHNHEDLK